MTRLVVACVAIVVASCASPTGNGGSIGFCPPNCPTAGGADLSAVVADGGARHDLSEPSDGGRVLDLSRQSPDLMTPIDMMTTCAHPICTAGAKLMSSCDPCVASICASDSYCCGTAWSTICVAKVTSVCGKSCP